MNTYIKTFSIIISAVFMLLQFSSAAVQAATIAVNTTVDEDDSGGDCSVREALNRIDLGSDGAGCAATGDVYGTNDTVNLQNGVSYVLDGGYLEANVSVTINGNGATIDGNGIDSVFIICPGVACSADVAINDLTITNGSALGNGGGIFNYGTLGVNNSAVSNNTASLNGGGIFNQGAMAITGSTISGNISTSGGAGGIFNNSAMAITNSTISGNQDSLGTGGVIQQGIAIFTNTTISGNTGAGVQNTFATVVASAFNNVTIANNTGTGYAHAQSVSFQNSIVANNGTDCSSIIRGSFADIGWNLDSDNSCAFAALPGVNPQLGALADNGGPTFTHALLTNSPAIDAGNPAGCTWDDDSNPATTEVLLTQDQRGTTRPLDGDSNGSLICDIGAYELSIVSPGDTGNSGEGDGGGGGGGCAFVYDTNSNPPASGMSILLFLLPVAWLLLRRMAVRRV